MVDVNLGNVKGADGASGSDGSDGKDGATIWTTSVAPDTPDYTFLISNLDAQTGRSPMVGDLIVYGYYRYTISSVGESNVLAGDRVSIRGATGATGATGEDGNSILGVAKTGTSGLVDTYTISYSKSSPSTFNVTNGASGVDIVTSWESTLSDTKVPSEKLTKETINTKLNSSGHTASKNLVTDSSGAVTTEDKPTIPTKTSDLTNDGDDGTNVFVKNNDSRLTDARTPTSHTHGNITNDGKIGSSSGKIITTGTGGAVQASDSITKSQISDFPTLATVATSGSYNDLLNKPTIPSSSSDLSDGSDIIKKSNTSGLVKNDGTIDTTSYSTFSGSYNDLSNKPTLSSLGGTVTIEKQQTAETGYVATYVVKQGGTSLSPKINIPMDYLVKSGEVKTCTTANVPIQGLNVGDKYLDFTVNVKSGTATDEHIYISVKDLTDVYSADESTLTLSNSNVFSLKNSNDYLKKSVDTGLVKNDGSIDTNTYVQTVTGKGLSENDFTDTYKNKLDGIEAQANKTTVDSALSGSSENPVQNKVINTALAGKVDTVSGKGLSENDFTTTLKNKLDGIASGAEVNVNADWNASSGDAQILNKPTIPSKTSDLTNDSGFITSSSVPTGSSTATDIKMNGTQSAGSSTKYAKADHVHPTDTSRVGSVTVTQTLTSGTKLGSISVDGTSTDLYCTSGGSSVTKTSDLTNDGDDGTHPFLDTSDLVNDLTTGGTTKALSAEQGKALNTLIGNAISYINQ